MFQKEEAEEGYMGRFLISNSVTRKSMKSEVCLCLNKISHLNIGPDYYSLRTGPDYSLSHFLIVRTVDISLDLCTI